MNNERLKSFTDYYRQALHNAVTTHPEDYRWFREPTIIVLLPSRLLSSLRPIEYVLLLNAAHTTKMDVLSRLSASNSVLSILMLTLNADLVVSPIKQVLY